MPHSTVLLEPVCWRFSKYATHRSFSCSVVVSPTNTCVPPSFPVQYSPTVEDKFTKHLEVNGKAVFAEILDTAGQDQYSDLRPHFLPHGDAFILVYSIDDNETFEKIDEFHEQIFQVNERAAQLPFILIGNKCDMESKRRVEVEEGQVKRNELQERGGKVIFFEASAKDNINVEEAFRKAIAMSLEMNTSSASTSTTGVMGAGKFNTYESGNSKVAAKGKKKGLFSKCNLL